MSRIRVIDFKDVFQSHLAELTKSLKGLHATSSPMTVDALDDDLLVDNDVAYTVLVVFISAFIWLIAIYGNQETVRAKS